MLRDIGGKDRAGLEKAGFAVHVVYERVGDLNATKKKIVDGYMGGFCHMLTTRQALNFGGGAPQNLILDLRTMKVLAKDMEHDEAIKTCNAL